MMPWASPSLIHHGSSGDSDGRSGELVAVGVGGVTRAGVGGAGMSSLSSLLV